MNKRGWMRIMEASIAAIVILSTLFYLYNRAREPSVYDMTEKARAIVDEIAVNETLRYDILTSPAGPPPGITYTVPDNVQDRVYSLLNDASLDSEIKICSVEDVCGKSNFTGETYSAERIISSAIKIDTPHEPRKIRLFIWRK